MAEIISFNESARLKKQLEERDAELEAVKAELKEAKEKLGMVMSVNELLRLQIQDLLFTLQTMAQTVETTVKNLKGLQSKLPKF